MEKLLQGIKKFADIETLINANIIKDSIKYINQDSLTPYK
jgi:hypothetical protein